MKRAGGAQLLHQPAATCCDQRGAAGLDDRPRHVDGAALDAARPERRQDLENDRRWRVVARGAIARLGASIHEEG